MTKKNASSTTTSIAMNALETIGTTDAADAVLSVATAVKKIDPHMQLLITLGGALWQKMTETKPYSKEDKKQYDQLIHLYTNMLLNVDFAGTASPPTHGTFL